MFTLRQPSRETLSALSLAISANPQEMITQATHVLQGPDSRLALLHGPVAELYRLKTAYTQATYTVHGQEAQPLLRTDILAIGLDYDGSAVVTVTPGFTAELSDLTGRYEFNNASYVGNTNRMPTSKIITSLTVNGREYTTPAALSQVLFNYGDGDDFTFYGWACAKLTHMMGDFGVLVYPYGFGKGWTAAYAGAITFQRQQYTSHGVQHTRFLHTGTHEEYNVMGDSRYEHYSYLGRPLTLGSARQLDSYFQPEPVEQD